MRPPWRIWQDWKEALKRAQDGEFDGASGEAKARAVTEVIRSSSTTAAVLALQPFPIVDVAVLSPIHHDMVECISRIRGHSVDVRAIRKEILSPLLGEICTHHLTIIALKLVPFADFLAAAVAYGLTYAVGTVSDEYFRRGRAMSKSDMKASFERAYEHAYEEKRNELRTKFSKWRSGTTSSAKAATPGG